MKDNMRQYVFNDSDFSGNEEYDIVGADYIALLESCFRYCKSVSFLFDINNADCHVMFDDLQDYRLPVTENVKMIYDHYGHFDGDVLRNYEIRHFSLVDVVESKIIEVTDSMFKWLCGWGHSNPADPAFFRADGTVFFHSLIHEGVCTLLPRDDEDVRHIVCGNKWKKE